MLKWKLRSVMADRKVSNKKLAKLMGVHRNTIQLLKSDSPTMIRLKHLEELCHLLNCKPNDLFEFQAENPVT